MELRAYTNVFGKDANGVQRENSHATSIYAPGKVTDVAVPPPGVPGAAVAQTTGDFTQALGTTGQLSMVARLSNNASGGCDWYCSNASGISNAFGYLEFRLDSGYSYELSESLAADQASGYWAGGSGFDLYSLSSSSMMDSASLSLGPSTPSSASLLKTGLLGPGLYYLGFSAFGSNITPYSGTGSFDGQFSFDFKLSSVPSPVPLPAGAWLLLSGLGGVAAFARGRRVTSTAQPAALR